MIHKKDKPPEIASSYRPISLISCIAKWMEKIVNKKLLSWLESKNHLPPCQPGFRKNMSTHDHFFRLYNSIIHGFNDKSKTGVIFLTSKKHSTK